jgi:hypothetical protein
MACSSVQQMRVGHSPAAVRQLATEPLYPQGRAFCSEAVPKGWLTGPAHPDPVREVVLRRTGRGPAKLIQRCTYLIRLIV